MTRVLVIDDHRPSRAYLGKILPKCGYEIVGETASAKAAVVFAHTKNPDVILLAVGLPDMDGIEAAQEIMGAKPLPVIITTSHCDAATIERANRAGVMGYLVKPLRAEELRPAVELAISRFQELAALQQENSSLKEALEARKVIERAKGLLMEQRKLAEPQAYALLKKASMNLRKPMADVAQAILLAGGLSNDKKN
jgi:AmiR/NasT family two-component response regulator